MDMIADILLAAGAFGAGLYCFVLARRLNRFNNLQGGIGGAVATLSSQVDELSRTLSTAQASAGSTTDSLGDITERAENVARRLELLVASMHDLPAQVPETQANGSSQAVFSRRTTNGSRG
ncbi:hypothetical protein [Pseudooceanicola pacificus]|uniref:hypothetical protein n=1 Tax=Pseudooceanicola pacificus TaxID=2676438 RepID=UPI002E26ACAE